MRYLEDEEVVVVTCNTNLDPTSANDIKVCGGDFQLLTTEKNMEVIDCIFGKYRSSMNVTAGTCYSNRKISKFTIKSRL